MGKPTIGDANIPDFTKKEEKKRVEKLTVLKEGDRNTIYSLIFQEVSKHED